MPLSFQSRPKTSSGPIRIVTGWSLPRGMRIDDG
jgi:hypothetical protein